MRCGHETYKSFTSETIKTEFGYLVIENIPCYKCEECNEIFYSGDVVLKIEEITKKVRQLAPKITIIDYQKAA